MDRKDADIIGEALKSKHENETFERALGRAIRERGGGFERYIELISEVRELSRKKKIAILEATQILAGNRD